MSVKDTDETDPTRISSENANPATTDQQTNNAREPPSTHNTSSSTSLSNKRESSWPSVLFYIHLNILGLYGIAVLFTNTYFTTVIFTTFLTFIGIIGMTCGAHRLWAHRTYTANTFLRIMLMLCQTMAGQVKLTIPKKITLIPRLFSDRSID